jgi:hypothetical protein
MSPRRNSQQRSQKGDYSDGRPRPSKACHRFPHLHNSTAAKRAADQPAAPFASRSVFNLFGAFTAPQHDHAQKNQRKNCA